MRAHRILLFLALALLASTACEKPAPASDPAETLAQAGEQAREQVSRRLFSYPAVVQRGQLDSIMSFWASDVRIFENEVHVSGDSALRAIGKEFFPQFDVTRLAYAPTETVAHDTGRVVYQFGYFTEDIRRKGETAVTNMGNNFAARWTTDASGGWRLHRFITTPAPRPSAPPPTVPAVAPVASTQPVMASTIEQRMREYVAALRSRDPATILSFWADDGRYMQSNIELNDKPAITKFVNDAYARRTSGAVEMTSDEVFLHDGEVAYQLGSCNLCLVAGATSRDQRRPALPGALETQRQRSVAARSVRSHSRTTRELIRVILTEPDGNTIGKARSVRWNSAHFQSA